MNVSRRTFLGGAIIVAAAAAIPLPALDTLPKLYADGITDDTEAMQAMLDGKPVYSVASKEVIPGAIDGRIFIQNLTVRISKSLTIRHSGTVMQHCKIINTSLPTDIMMGSTLDVKLDTTDASPLV